MRPEEAHALAVAEGLNSESAIIATAIAWAESDLDPYIEGDIGLQDDVWGPSIGLWQVRSLRAQRGTGGERDVDRLKEPAFNAHAMAVISAGGTNWTPWTMFKNGRYRDHLEAVRAAVKGAPMTPVQIIHAATSELEELGYKVTFVDGWEDRGRPGTFEPQGLLWHHTATSRWATGDYPSLDLIVDGRSDLAGPLAQFGLGRSGRVYVVAAGKANHAGGGSWAGLSGNATVWGIEAENDGIGEPWPSEQIDAYIAFSAALARYTGFDANMICRHAEWSDGGKIDTATDPLNDGDWIRAQVAARLDDVDPPLPPDPPKEDRMATPHILLTYGSGVALWHDSGDVLTLRTDKQVIQWLEAGAVVMDDLTAEQVEQITGAKAALTSGPALADVLAERKQEPLGCAGED